MLTQAVRLLKGDAVKFSDLPSLFAEALHGDENICADEVDTCSVAELALKDEFERMVDAGELIVLDPLTLAPQKFPLGNVLANSVLTEKELRPLLETKGIALIVESARQTLDRIIGSDFFPTGTYLYNQATQDIAQAQGWDDVRQEALESDMASAINAGELPTYDRKTGLRHVRGEPLEDYLLVTPEDVNQWLDSRGAAYRWLPVQEATMARTVSQSERQQQWAAQGEKMKERGRHTLAEAAGVLSTETGMDKKRWLQTIVNAVMAGDLAARNPKDFDDLLPYAPSKITGYEYPIRDDYEQTDASSLNAWLAKHPEWNVSFRFDEPAIDCGKAADGGDVPNDAQDWRQRIRDMATEWCRERQAGGKPVPTKTAVAKEMAARCRNENILTDTGIHPAEGYIRNHVLNTWAPP